MINLPKLYDRVI